jgi:hypothetical protein
MLAGMSYSFSTGQVSKADAVAAIDAAADQAIQGIHEPCRQPAYEHVARLQAALPALLEVVGSDECTVSITVSGHANPGHGKYEGWADEMLNVQISALEPVPAEPDVEPAATE